MNLRIKRFLNHILVNLIYLFSNFRLFFFLHEIIVHCCNLILNWFLRRCLSSMVFSRVDVFSQCTFLKFTFNFFLKFWQLHFNSAVNIDIFKVIMSKKNSTIISSLIRPSLFRFIVPLLNCICSSLVGWGSDVSHLSEF